MITGYIHHYPNYALQDDGFGNLIDTGDMFNINFSKYHPEE